MSSIFVKSKIHAIILWPPIKWHQIVIMDHKSISPHLYSHGSILQFFYKFYCLHFKILIEVRVTIVLKPKQHKMVTLKRNHSLETFAILLGILWALIVSVFILHEHKLQFNPQMSSLRSWQIPATNTNNNTNTTLHTHKDVY